MKVIDASDSIVGRLSSAAAKLVLDGEQVVIVNAEKAVISGNPKETFSKYLKNIHRGFVWSKVGPYQPRMPDRIIRRTIRGMLPYKKDYGRKAFKRVKVYMGLPDKYKGKEERLDKTQRTSAVRKFITLGELSKKLGAKL